MRSCCQKALADSPCLWDVDVAGVSKHIRKPVARLILHLCRKAAFIDFVLSFAGCIMQHWQLMW